MAPNGRILYVVTNQGYVTPVDLVKGTAEPPIRIGGSPTDMLVSRDGNTGYVLDRNSLGVSIVDLARHKAAGFIKTPDAWSYALTPDGRTLYVANDTASRITPIDTATRSALPPVTIDGNFPTSPSGGNGEVVVAPDGAAYAFGDVVDAGGFDGFVTPVSTATTTAPKPIVLGFTLINVLGISPDSRTAYIGSESGVAAVSLATGRVMWMARLPATGWITGLPPARGHLGSQAVISPDGQNLYTLGTTGLSSGLLTFYRISATTGAAQTSEVPVGQTLGRTFGSMDIVLSPDGRTLVAEPSARVADSGLPEPLVPIDVATRRAGRFITGGGGLIFGP
jgi:DNA-binding beta-propeller fold protein YncE